MQEKIFRFDTMLQAAAAAEGILRQYDCPKLEFRPTADGRAILIVTYEHEINEGGSEHETDPIHH